jgi:hypothetical protein
VVDRYHSRPELLGDAVEVDLAHAAKI